MCPENASLPFAAFVCRRVLKDDLANVFLASRK